MIDFELTQSFFNPSSIAIIGASSNEKKTGSRIQRYLVSHGYKGRIFPVNPNRDNIFGLRCYPNLKKINEKIDHIFIALDGDKIIGKCGLFRMVDPVQCSAMWNVEFIYLSIC